MPDRATMEAARPKCPKEGCGEPMSLVPGVVTHPSYIPVWECVSHGPSLTGAELAEAQRHIAQPA